MKVRILYIAGNGRSGSTLLDRVLGRALNAMSLGETRFVWELGLAKNNLCECGSRFRDCGFWGEVSREAFGEVDEARGREIAAQSRKLLWTPRIPQIRGWVPAGSRKRFRDEQVQLLGKMYRAIARRAGTDVLIDSSKISSYAHLLSRVPDIELHVVHLVRDSRALAFSWKRKKLKPEVVGGTEYMPVRPAFLTGLRWNLHNLLSQSLAKVASSYVRVRYEDFVRDPVETVHRVQDSIGMDRQIPRGFLSDDEVELARGHTVAGNPSRFKRGPIRIRVDDEWHRRMHILDRSLVTLVTFPQLLAYGYPLRSPRDSHAPEGEVLETGHKGEKVHG